MSSIGIKTFLTAGIVSLGALSTVPAMAYGDHGERGGNGGGNRSAASSHVSGGASAGRSFSSGGGRSFNAASARTGNFNRSGNFNQGRVAASRFNGARYGEGYRGGYGGHGYNNRGYYGGGYYARGYWGGGFYGYWPAYAGFGYYYDSAAAYPYMGLAAWDIGYNEELNETDLRAQQNAVVQATTAPIDQSITWSDGTGNASGSITPLRDGRTADGRLCREFQQNVTIEGQRQSAHGTACQGPDGAWQVVNPNS